MTVPLRVIGSVPVEPLNGKVVIDTNNYYPQRDGHIADFGQEVRACALGQASAGVLGAVALGRSRDEIARARDELQAMLKTEAPVPATPFDGLEALLPAREFPNRHASILLAWEALLGAIDASPA